MENKQQTMQQKKKSRLRKAVIIIAWLMIWQMISLWVDNSILLVGPAETIVVLLGKLVELSFWETVFGSLLRILAGFLAGWTIGLLLAALSAANEWVEEALKPVMTLMKTVPIASFVVLFLIWFRTDILAVVISLCVVLPNVYLSTLEGIKSTDGKLLEMAGVHGVHPVDRFFYIYRPALKPFWNSCMKMSVGMSWKSGVAAEVIGTPDFSIGEQLYMSKIYLDTAGVLCWTAVIIAASILCEKIFCKLWNIFLEWQPECRGTMTARQEYRESSGMCRKIRNSADLVPGWGNKGAESIPKQIAETLETVCDNDVKKFFITLQGVSKSYSENPILERFDAEYEIGQVYYFRTPSGSGKTTLFRLIAGLEMPDSGQIQKNGSLAYAFQEDRLCESYSALKNVELVTGDRDKAYGYLISLLDAEDIQKQCGQLSGGMKRRVAVARAFAAESDIVLLDEPFAGLDEENRKRMLEYIAEHGREKAVLIATHV